jgi:membrane protein required for colicin V production
MIIDILVLAALAAAIFKGYTKGLIVAVFAFASLILGAAAAIKLGVLAGNYLQQHTSIEARWAPLLGFVIIFVGIVVLVRMVAAFIEKSAEAISLGWLNKLGGIVFYLALYFLVISILFFYITKLNFISAYTLNDSVAYRWLSPFAPAVMELLGKLIPWFADLFKDLESFFDGLAEPQSRGR